MDGQSLLYELRNLINESSGSGFLDTRTSYDFLWEAATALSQRLRNLTATQSITTVADQTDYTLNADFLEVFLMDTENRRVLKYNNGTTNDWLIEKDYNEIIYEDNTTSTAAPSFYAVIDDTQDSQVSGTATSTAAQSGGIATLTDTAGDFSDVSAGDVVHNTTDGSDGIVTAKTSSTVLSCALFGGTNDDWSSSDAYIIQPQGRMKIFIDPPPSTAGHTITVNYIQRPSPVFSNYGAYRFQAQYKWALIKYAAWLYKYRDAKPNFGDAFFKFWDAQTRIGSAQYKNTATKNKYSVSFKKR